MEDKMFGFPATQRGPRHQFKRNLLQTAIFQIKFPINHGILEEENTIKQALSPRYPNVTRVESNTGKFDISPEGTPVLISSSKSHDGFEFRSANNQRILAITKDALTLSILGASYSNSFEVLDEFKKEYLPLIKQLGIDVLNRVAIRKINMLEAVIEKTEDHKNALTAIYNNTLVSNMVFMPTESNLDSSLNHTGLINTDGGYKLGLHYGLLEKNPKQGNKRNFTYDIDIYTVGREVSVDDLLSEFKKINEEMYNVFIWGINPELIHRLGGGSNA